GSGTGPAAAFTTANVAGTCTNKYQFTNNTTGGTGISYTWNFGDGTTSAQTSPSRSYGDSGTFNVILTAVNGSCTSVATAQVYISSAVFGPSASFTINNASQVINNQGFNFINASKHVGGGWNSSYAWSFGDGSPIDTIHNSVYGKTYLASGTYNVSLAVTTYDGCTDVFTQPVTVSPIVVSKFGYNQNACANRSVAFKDSSAQASTYLWNFGDGITSIQSNPIHIYSKDSVYNVRLTINGNVVSNQYITVATTPPDATIAANADCSNTYRFGGAPAGNSYNYNWTFTGGTGSSTNIFNPTRSYTNPAPTTVSVSVNSYGLCVNNASPSYNFTPGTLTGAVIAGVSVSAPSNNLCSNVRILTNTSSAGMQSYTYSVDGSAFDTISTTKTLTSLSPGIHYIRLAVKKGTCFDTAATEFYISVPTASFTSFSSSCNHTVTFTNTSVSSDNVLLRYSWKFGSPALDSSVAQNPFFVYPVVGNNTANLLVTSSSGCAATVTNNVLVNAGTGTLAAEFTSAQVSGSCGNKIQFTNTTTGGTGLSYTWNFGDDTYSTGVNPVMSFGDTGAFTITLTALSGSCQSLVSHKVYISPTAYGPAAGFTINNASQLLTNNRFDFPNTSVNLNAGWIAKSYWSYGDGTIDSVFSTYSKIYTTPGTYLVKLIVLSSTGCIDSAIQTVNVLPVATSNFSYSGNSCSSNTLTFSNLSTLATSYLWNFGDGDTSTLSNPVHAYNRDSIYTASLTINGNLTSIKTIVIATTPSAFFTSLANSCNSQFDFIAAQKGYGITYAWHFSNGTYTDTTVSNPTLTFNTATTSAVSLTITSGGQCLATSTPLTINSQAGVKSDFTLTASDYCGTSRVLTNTGTGGLNYVYSLDGSAYNTISSPVSLTSLGLGNHTIKMMGDNGVCFDSVTRFFNIASLTGSFTSVPSQCNRSVAFTPAIITSDGSVPAYLWNFGGTDTSTVSTPAFFFSSTGSKTVALKVTAVSGCTLTVNNNVVVGTGLSPLSTFMASEVISSVCNAGFNFTATSPNATSYIWDYGDGTVYSATSSVTSFHSYIATGIYVAKVTSINAMGCSTISLPQNISVTTAGKPTPTTKFELFDSVECLSTNKFDFSNISVLTGNGWIVNYKWDFGDGTTDFMNTSIFGKHYNRTGKFYITLTATSNLGCSSIFVLPVRVISDSLCGLTAIQNIKGDISNNINLYPNPNTGTFNLDLKGIDVGASRIIIIDMLGREIFATEIFASGVQEINLKTQDLTAGKYYLVLTTGYGEVARKPFAVAK
ncbi:MAG: PKD domain-containing protein, partial [Bacteroidia bacterium]|nr:PKD domain-containing protein [Bacteroidia bacterium]